MNAAERQWYKAQYTRCVSQAKGVAGNSVGFNLLGTGLQRALVAEQILILAYSQDEDGVDAEAVRGIVTVLTEMLNTDAKLAV